MPKEDRFFGLFEQHATLVVAGAESLRAGLEGGPALRQHLQTVMDRENEADAITREVILAVRRTFITPFDRGDIGGFKWSSQHSLYELFGGTGPEPRPVFSSPGSFAACC